MPKRHSRSYGKYTAWALGALGELDGVDLLDLGSDDRGTMITVGGGFRYHFTDNVQIGVGAETPITDNDDSILDYRLYVDLVLYW